MDTQLYITTQIRKKRININRIDNQKTTLIISILIIVTIFSSWDFLQWINSLQSYYGSVMVSSSEFQSINSWMPLIRGITNGNLFPSAPTVDPEAQRLLYYPYLSLWISGALVSLFGMPGIIIIGQVLLPTLTFYLLVKIFQRYLNSIWSIAISFSCIISFSDWPFRSFLAGLFKGLNLYSLGVVQPLEITHFPIPSLSIFVFLLLFYISTSPVKLTLRRITILTLLWGVHTQFHAIDALFGLAFWFFYFPLRLYRQSKSRLDSKLIMMVLSQGILALMILFPFIYGWLTTKSEGPGFAHEIGIVANQTGSEVGLFYYLAYFLIPIILMICIYVIKRVDIYEIFFKFWHIYLLMLIEVILISSNRLFIKGIDIDMVQNRIALFFLHFYYYVPVVYYAAQPAGYTYSFGAEATSVSKRLAGVLLFIFNRLSRIYLPIIIVLLILFAYASSYKNYQHQKNVESPALAKAWGEYEEIKKYIPENGTIVSQTPAVNMLAAIVQGTQYGSLWVNRFSNNISIDEAIERLMLYAHIYSWPAEKFVSFMLPGKLQQKRGALIDISPDQVQTSGVGYWLVFHKSALAQGEENYKTMISNKYKQFDVINALRKYNINYIYAYNDLSELIPVKAFKKTDNGYIYQVELSD